MMPAHLGFLDVCIDLYRFSRKLEQRLAAVAGCPWATCSIPSPGGEPFGSLQTALEVENHSSRNGTSSPTTPLSRRVGLVTGTSSHGSEDFDTVDQKTRRHG